MKKLLLLLILILILSLTLVGCGSDQPTGGDGPEEEQELIELSLEELREFNGQDGNPAYIAVDGVIYNVSNSRRWANGEHNGYRAGNDLSDEIRDISPHGARVLERMPVVGNIVE